MAGVECPIGVWARLDPTLNDKALELARLAEHTMAEAFVHLLACGIKSS